MKIRSLLLASLTAIALTLASAVDAQIAPSELVAPKLEISGGNLNFTVQPSVVGRNYQLQCSDTLQTGTWTNVGVLRSGNGSNLVISTPHAQEVAQRFYRLVLTVASPAPVGFSLISAGSFQMGDQSDPQVGYSNERPMHSVYVSAFYMAKYEVTKALWDEVRSWGLANEYTTLPFGGGKHANGPVHSIDWIQMVKWCNARSQKEGLTPCYYTDATQTVVFKTGNIAMTNEMVKWMANGYRLPTEAEWEKAARGGLAGRLFPWGDTISHSQANYEVYSSDGTTNFYSYDVTPRPGYSTNFYYHPTYNDGVTPYTAPVGSFAANGYGLYDMAGNLRECCWDNWLDSYYSSSPGTDPRGPSTPSNRVNRGGSWADSENCRVAYRNYGLPISGGSNVLGFRLVRSVVP